MLRAADGAGVSLRFARPEDAAKAVTIFEQIAAGMGMGGRGAPILRNIPLPLPPRPNLPMVVHTSSASPTSQLADLAPGPAAPARQLRDPGPQTSAHDRVLHKSPSSAIDSMASSLALAMLSDSATSVTAARSPAAAATVSASFSSNGSGSHTEVSGASWGDVSPAASQWHLPSAYAGNIGQGEIADVVGHAQFAQDAWMLPSGIADTGSSGMFPSQ